MSVDFEQARIVVIGGGAVGASCLYHLALAGWTDCVLLEKNELTAGSTWHAAGNVPTFSSSWSIMNVQRYSAELYRNLAAAVDYPMNYNVTGSLRLGHTPERMTEFRRVVGMGRYQGMDLDMVGANELRERYPFLETHDLRGALYDPYDGDIDPAQLTQALAKGSRDLGARIERYRPVTGIRRDKNEWIVETPKGGIRCEIIVNAAGYYAREIGKMIGREVPMVAMSHQYLVFDEIPELKEWSQEAGRKLPLLRDVDSSYYLRQEKFGMNLGPYERGCRAHWVDNDDPMPNDFSFQLYPDDLDRLEWYIDDAVARVPILGTAGLSKVINGPIPYAPDGNPLIGPMPGVPNAFEACVFTFGICQAGGAGKVLAEWVTEGETEWDMWSCDPRRYTAFADRDYCIAKAKEVYGHEYAIHFPWHRWPAGKDKKLSPVHWRILELGGQMGAYNGWERANWFAQQGDDTSEEATQRWSRSGPWEQRIKEECEAVRDSVGVLDLPGFSRFNLTGQGAAGWLRTRIAGGLPRSGRMNLAYFSDRRGRIVTEMSILRHGENHFTLITAAGAEWHDFELLDRSLPRDAGISLSNHTDDFSTLVVTGPASRTLFETIAPEADLELPWLSHRPERVAGVQAALARVSYAGELGWEIHAKNEHIPKLYEAVIESGAKPFGMWALDSLRLEKGYRAWKGDLSTDYSLLEGGLDRFIRLDKSEDFPGKLALLKETQAGVQKRFVALIVDAGDYDAPYMSTIWKDGRVVGETTSGGWGYRVEASIALGMVGTEFAEPGTKLDVEIFGEMYSATVQEDRPLWDPENARLRA
ncbi:MAG: FAD-dependent oxidoreductase [Albidovulum sp.]|nr:FAD-dependent oxidoreductase [Albidovulum sp.]